MPEIFKQSVFETLFKESTLGIVVANDKGIIVMTNPHAEQLFGYDDTELTGEKIEILLPKDLHQRHVAYRDDYLKKPSRRMMGEGRELYGQRKDGSKFPLEISLNSFVIDGEKFAVAFVIDITVRMKTANALKESESRLSAVIDNALDTIVTMSRDGKILSINPAGADLFGYAQKELIGQDVEVLMPMPDKKYHRKYLEDYHNTGVKKIIDVGRNALGVKKNGTVFPIYIGVNEVKVNNNTIYTAILHDLTEQKKAEEQLRNYSSQMKKANDELEDTLLKLKKSEEELEAKVKIRTAALKESEEKLKASLSKEMELNELKSRFVSMASHEFRTPLSAILSSASLIQMYLEKGVPDKQVKHINRIKSSVNNLTNILNDFLSLEKLETGNVEVNFTSINFKDFMKEVLEEFQPMVVEKNTIAFEHEGKESVSVDVHLLKNILFNLLSNAVKYSSDQKNVEVNSTFSKQKLFVSIKDYGMGIPEEDQKHMFSQFFRAGNVTNIQGTGLGLIIVKRYLDLMNGTISFTSKQGEGTTFFLEIPMPPAD